MKKRNSVIAVDLDALRNNANVLRSYLRPDVQLMPVIKEDAYGHGAVEVARYLETRVEWFAVNEIEEGIELREEGIETPILVFGVPESEIAALYKQYHLTATVSAAEHFRLLPGGTEYHLNFDTGMGRLGYSPAQLDEVLTLRADHSALNCTGIYSHFATADELNSEKSGRQHARFKKIIEHFEPDLLAHMANTAGAIQVQEAQFDAVRTGMGLYGYSPGEVTIPNLKPVMTWETSLVQVKSIERSETVSYGAEWSAPSDGWVGVIPVGYADGIPRGLSGKFNALIGGKEYPSVGTVTMNYCMIFLGDNRLEAGVRVQLWYPGQTAADWAAKMSTIPYEMLTGVSRDIPRLYRRTNRD